MSTPTSARIASASRRSMPGMVQSRSRSVPKGAITSSMRPERRSMASSRKSRGARISDRLGEPAVDAGDGAEQVTLGAERGDHLVDASREALDGFIEEVQVGEDLAHDERVGGPEPAFEGLGKSRDLLAQLAPSQLGQHVGVRGPSHERLEHVPAGLAQDVGGY